MERLARLALLLERDETHGQRHGADRALQPPQHLQVGGHETRLEEQVLRRIAGDGQFGRQDEVRARFDRALVGVEDFLVVARQVADHGVDLGEADFHAGKAGAPAVRPGEAGAGGTRSGFGRGRVHLHVGMATIESGIGTGDEVFVELDQPGHYGAGDHGENDLLEESILHRLAVKSSYRAFRGRRVKRWQDEEARGTGRFFRENHSQKSCPSLWPEPAVGVAVDRPADPFGQRGLGTRTAPARPAAR